MYNILKLSILKNIILTVVLRGLEVGRSAGMMMAELVRTRISRLSLTTVVQYVTPLNILILYSSSFSHPAQS